MGESPWFNRIVVGVVVLLAAGVAWMWTSSDSTSSAGSDSEAATSTAVTPDSVDSADRDGESETRLVEARDYDQGDCAIWDTTDPLAVSVVVDCTKPHLIQFAGMIELPDAAGAPFATDDQWVVIFDQHCGPLVAEALGGPLDPLGRYAARGIMPSPEGWTANDDRVVWCGGVSVGEEASGELPLFEGEIDLDTQVSPTATGQCFVLTADPSPVPVDCAQPHEIETIGQAELTMTGDFPDEPSLARACAPLAEDSVAPGTVHSYSSWNFSEGSWNAGRRWTDCVIGAPGDVEGWASSTGSMRH